MAGNPFDQFDQQLPAGGNPFDQFDDPAPGPVRASSGGPTTRGRGPVPKEPLAPVNTSPWAGLQSRIEGLTASTLRGIGTISENTGDWLDLNVANLSGLTPEQIKNERQLGLIFDLADTFQKSADARNYQPDTSFDQVKEAFNPNANANRARAAAEFGEPGNYQPLSMMDRVAAVGDFVKDQTIVSLPDMVASIASLPTYVLARDQEIAERRVQLDGREGLPTAGDQLAAAPGAIIESALERFATGRVMPGGGSVGGTVAGRIAKETGVQAGTEMVEEGAANLSETVGTERGFSGQEFTDAALAGGLVGGPLGAGVQTAKEGVNAVRNRFAQPAPTAEANPFDQFDQEAEQPAAQATAQPEPQPVQPAPVAPAPAPAAPTSPAPVQPTAPPAAPVAAAGATIQPAEPPQVPSTQASQPPEPPVQPAAQPVAAKPAATPPPRPAAFTPQQIDGAFTKASEERRTLSQGEEQLLWNLAKVDTPAAFEIAKKHFDRHFSAIASVILNMAEGGEGMQVHQPAIDFVHRLALSNDKNASWARNALARSKLDYLLKQPAPPEPQAAQPAPAAQPPQPVAAPAAPQGNRRTVTTATGRKVDTEFQVVDLATLQAATGDLQNRDRTRATSDLQIQNIAGNLDPERLGDSAEADRGAPIVGPDNVVESGNGRVAAIRKAYESVPERAEAYRQFLQSQGYAIDGMAQPVLVRRRVTDMTPEERRAFVIEANTSATARLNAVEQAKSDADLVGDDVLQLYRGGEFGAAGNRDFVRSLVGKLPQSEQAALYGPDGALSQEGIRRIQNALLARAYDDTALLSKFTEDQDNNIRSIGGAMLDVAGAWAQLRADVRAGRVKPEFDITQSLVDAARRITVARDRGETVQQVLSQVDAFNPMNPLTERLIRTFYNKDLGRAAGRDKIAEALRAYAVEAQKQTTDAALFGDLPAVTPEQILDAQLGKRVEAAPAQQTSMFGAGGRPTQQAAPEPKKPAPGNQVKVLGTETGTYVDGNTSGKIEYVRGKNADGEFAGIVRLYDQSGKLVREVSLDVQSNFDSIGFHEAVFGPDSDAEITIDTKQQAAEDRATAPQNASEKKARLKELLSEIKIYMDKGALTGAEGARFRELAKEARSLFYDLTKPLTADKVRSKEERMSTLPAEIVVIAHADLMRSRDVYDRISEAAEGVEFNKDTAVDIVMDGNDPDITPQEMYGAFDATRDALRTEFGDKMVLYRAIGKQKEKATTNWATTREYALQFGDNVISREISIDDIVAVNVGPKGNYHEVIVGDNPNRAAPMQDRAATADDTIDVDGVQRPRTNSLGQPIHGTVEGVRNFWRWFGDSKVVDKQGRPIVVYRGEHGEETEAEFQTRLNSLTFTDDAEVASIYAMEPNNQLDYPEAPRVTAAYLRISSPIINNPMDPFVELSDLEGKLGRDEAIRIARKFAGRIEYTGNWIEGLSDEFASVEAMLDAAPERVGELYFDAYYLLDDADEVATFKAAGFDGAIHMGNGESADALEFRVFDRGDIKSATGNKGTYGRDTGNIMEDTLNDRRTTKRIDDQADTEGTAQDETDLLAELDEPAQQNTRGRGSSPEIMRVSFTDRRSWAEQAFADAGVDPDAATLWPIERQFDTLAKLVKDRFGITVQKTGTLQGRYAVDQMLDLYRNLQFMAFTMGMPANAFGLRGKLNLVLRKGMQYFGAYYPTAARVEGVTFPAGTIVLPKRSNSFAHEWMHALDHYLMQLFPEPNSFPLLSQQVRNKGVDYPAAGAKEAFVRLMDHLFYDQSSLAARILALELHLENPNISATAKAKAEAQLQSLKRGNARGKSVAPSDFRRTSAGFDPGNADYWANPQEMLARAFEAYTAFKVERAGGTTEAIAKGDMAYLSNADKRLAETFPKGDERFRIFAAFDELFMMMAKEQLIADGQAAAVPGNTSQFDPNVWHRTPATRPEYKGLAGAIRQTLDEMRQAAAQIRREDARPDNPKSLGQQIQDLSKVAFSVEMEALRIFERRYPNSKAIKMLANLLVPMPGSDRYVDRVFEDAAEMHYKANINRLSSIIERYQLEDLNETGIRVLRDLLISEDVRNAPENIRKAATEIRRLLDMEWYANQQAGLEIGYTKNGFLPRLLDMAMVMSDRAGFVSAASRVYEIIFDKEFGADVAEVMDRGDNFSGVVKFLRQAQKSGIDVKPMMKVLRKIRKMEAQMKTSDEPDILQGKIDQTSEELHELLSDIYDRVRSDKARFDAEAWYTAIMTADTNDFDAMSPTARYTKSRTLPPEADKLMEDYYINDPIEAIQTYLSQSARRTEYAKRFGPKSEKVKPLFKQMEAEGVSPDDQAYMVDMLSRLTGRARTNLPPTYAKFLSGVQALGIVTLLPRAVWSAVFEPVMAASRTGDIRNAFLPHVNMIKSIVGTADSKDWAEISRAIGLVTNSMADTLAANRFGGNYGDSIKTQRMMAQFGKRSLLHGITNASRIAILPLQHEYLHGLARRIIENRDAANSAALMREVGIKDPVAFSNWILESDRMPTVEELFDSNGIETKFGYEWITAMNRISEQTIQSPKAYNRPMMANNPHGRLIYGILSFSMTFYENVWKRSARQLAGMSQRTGKVSAAKYAALNMLPAFAVLFVAQTLMSTLREAVFNPERWEEWEKEGVLVERLLQLGFTRSFAFGLADVPIQGITGLKYQRDLSNMFVGAVPSYFLQAWQGMMQPFVNNSEKNNNAEYKAAQSAYQLVAAPMIARTLSLAPGGKLIDPLYGVGMQYFTSPSSRDAVADALVGEKDSRVKARERAEKKEATGGATGRETGRETGRKTGRETGRDTGG